MATTSPVPMIDPTGTLRMIPSDQVDAATKAGGQPAMHMIDPTGTSRWIPQDQQDAALKAGGKLAEDETIRRTGLDPNASPADMGSQVWNQVTGDKDDSMTQAITGAASSLSEIPATIGGVLHRIGGNLIGNSGPITDAFKQMAGTPRDTTSAKAGALFETMAEWMVGEGELKALTQGERMAKIAPVVKMLEKYPKLSEAAIAHPEIVKLLPDAMRQGILGASQTAAHGGTAAESLESGATAGSLGLALPMAAGAGANVLRGMQAAIGPTIRELEGVKFTQLASEFKGPEGQPLPTTSKVAQKAGQYSGEIGLQQERQAAFKQMQTNLAKKGLGNFLNDANEAAASSSVGGDIQATPGAPTAPGAPGAEPSTWRYIPPDGSTSLTADETRAAMNELKQRWLDKEWAPGQETQIKQAYNDMQDQLARHDAYHAAQPVAPHDVEGAVGAVNSYGDVASHLDVLAKQQMRDLSPTIRSQYLDLANERKGLQDAFDEARDNPNQRDLIMEKLDDLNQRMEGLFQQPGAANLTESPGAMGQAFKTQRAANAFRKLQNTMDQHFNLRADVASDINRPRVATKLNSLGDHIEQVKSQYGDVLNPVLGDQGLNHITELGDLLKTQGGVRPTAKGFMENVAEVLRKQFTGGRAVLTSGGAAYMAHLLGTAIGGPLGGLGVLGGEAAYRNVVNRMATDPKFAETLISAMKNNRTPQTAAALLGAYMKTEPTREMQQQRQEQEEPSDAGSK
jgi:hypothetical protein